MYSRPATTPAQSIPVKYFRNPESRVADLAIVKIDEDEPLSGLVPATLEVLSKEQRAAIQKVSIIAFNGLPGLPDIRNTYHNKITDKQLIKGIRDMLPDKLSIATDQGASFVSLFLKQTEDATMSQQCLVRDTYLGNGLVYRVSTLGGSSGGMVLVDGRFVGESVFLLAFGSVANAVSGIHLGIIRVSVNEERVKPESCGIATMFSSCPAYEFIQHTLADAQPSVLDFGPPANGRRKDYVQNVRTEELETALRDGAEVEASFRPPGFFRTAADNVLSNTMAGLHRGIIRSSINCQVIRGSFGIGLAFCFVPFLPFLERMLKDIQLSVLALGPPAPYLAQESTETVEVFVRFVLE